MQRYQIAFRRPECQEIFKYSQSGASQIRQLEIASRLDDLRVPPGNRLEALKDDRFGQYSIRINDQWRLCFQWTDAGADHVEIVDYH